MTPPRHLPAAISRRHDFAARRRLRPISRVSGSAIFTFRRSSRPCPDRRTAMTSSTHLIEACSAERRLPSSGGCAAQPRHRPHSRLRSQPHGSKPAECLVARCARMGRWPAPTPEHFDVDWSAPKLIVPALASSYGMALEQGEFGLAFDAGAGNALDDVRVCSAAYAALLCSHPGPRSMPTLCGACAALRRRHAGNRAELKTRSLRLARDPALRCADRASRGMRRRSNRPALHALHEQQVWRLAHWRAARETLTYRRFFEIADLVGVRVERPRVFDDVHAHVLELVARGRRRWPAPRPHRRPGRPAALPPAARRRRSAARSPLSRRREDPRPRRALRPDWPVAGTTGYEFIAPLSGLLVDWSGARALTEAY